MRLPDALLLRDAWMGGTPRQREYNSRIYEGASVWLDEEGAKAAAAAIRSQGRLARVTREHRPARASPGARIYSKRPVRAQKTNIYSPRRDRYMWVVWSSIEPAHAANPSEETAS